MAFAVRRLNHIHIAKFPLGGIRSEQLELAVTRLLCVLDSVAELVKLRFARRARPPRG